ncbi:MAG: dicarboxylate/amino acid:cation symporter [Bacteroidaceae bacterium]|nr:dicarboxylate/amino acid:cation symporter [Bacteroidaceae bacterium]
MKLPLLLRIVIAIGLGIILGLVMPGWLVGVFSTFNGVFSNLLKFLVPLIIIGLVTPAIADIGRSAGRLLVITVLIAYSSTCLSALFSYGVSATVFPSLIPAASAGAALVGESASVSPYFTMAIPPLFDVMSALVMAFIVGLGCAYMGLPSIKAVADDFRKLIERTISVLVIPLLPLYIFGIFAEMTFTGQAVRVVMAFAAIIMVIFVMHVVLLLVQFCIAGAVTHRSPLRMLFTMLPAYFTALGTSSSAATIPVTFRQTVKLGVDEGVAGFTVPLCATIHMSGSAMKITACAVALMLMQGMEIVPLSFVGFTLMLGIMMVASPGVPGGAIMASLGILTSMLGFSDQDCALMIALYIAMDSFGTACNVTGDGAIAVLVNKLHAHLS